MGYDGLWYVVLFDVPLGDVVFMVVGFAEVHSGGAEFGVVL